MARIPIELTPEGLSGLLYYARVDIGVWGKGEANTVEQFYAELQKGESSLRVDWPRVTRVLRIVKLIIEDPERGMLLEDYQIMADGRRKDRQQTPGGKIGSDESPTQAVYREMSEELHLGSTAFSFTLDGMRVEEKASKSYPTLRSIYEIYPARIKLAAHISIEDGYNTVDGEDGQKRLFFKWSVKKQEA